MSELILELFSEEIPAKIQKKFTEKLQALATNSLNNMGFLGELEVFVTPRRVTVLANNLTYETGQNNNHIRGPKLNAHAKAIQGFLQKHNLQNIEQLTLKKVGKEEYYFFIKEFNSETIIAELTKILNKLILDIAKLWPKTMRWNSTNARWVRPLRNILCLYDNKILPLEYADIKANNLTYGHRFLGQKAALNISTIKSYKDNLKAEFVILAQAERQNSICDEINKICAANNLVLHEDSSLLEEVAGLVEYPVVLMGEIQRDFMHLPEEVLITTLKNHQKYFCVRNKAGDLAPYFIFVSNNDAVNNQVIINGNERVLRARLEDAKFFFDEDLKISLSDRFNNLEKIIFHQKVGNLKNQSENNANLAKYISVWVKNSHPVDIEVAARLAKVDLTTEMVSELPELQGVMGSYYAKAEDLTPNITAAIKDHYKPRSMVDDCPADSTSICVALADRVNNLVALTLAGEKPTGSKDPYGLRRSAIAIVRIIIDKKLNIPLGLVVTKSLNNYNILLKKAGGIYPAIEAKALKEHVKNELVNFIFDKLRNLLKGQNVSQDIINAVFNDNKLDDLTKIRDMSLFLDHKLRTDEGQKLLAAYNRASNIYLKAEKEDGVSYHKRLHLLMWKENSEKELFSAYKTIKSNLPNLLKSDDYEAAFNKLTEFINPIECFFAELVVNDKDKTIRQNRLKLLATLCKTVNCFANFSKIEKSFNLKNK